MRKKIIASLPCILISLYVIAQDSSRVTTLREVVVSATRTEQPVIETPRSVTIINQDILSKTIYNSLGDLLNAQSGLFVVGANQTPGTNQNVFMRGASSNQVAVLIDGVRITDPSSPNAAIDLSEISLLNVDRVEIIRGSHSTMYGGAAIGGVINIITKNNSDPGFHGSAAWQGGAFGKDAWLSTENLDLNYTFKNGMYMNGSVFQQNANGFDSSEKTESTTSFTADKDDFEKTDVFLKGGFRNKSWDAFISYKNVHQQADVDNGAFTDDDNYYLMFDRSLLEYRLKHKLNEFWEFTTLGSFSSSERFYENDSSQIGRGIYDKSYSRGTYYGSLQTHEIQLNYQKEKVKGILGTGLYREEMFFDNYFFYNDPDYPFELITNYDTLDTSTRTQYVFGQLGYGTGGFNIAAGSRLSHHTTAGNYLTFEINPSYTFNDNFLLYGSLSSGFNAPTLYQLYDPSKGATAFTTRGNQNLKPEQSLSIEGGIKKEFSSGSYLTLSAFQTAVRNSIEYIYLWNGDKPIADLDYSDDRGDTYMNVARQIVSGFEIAGFVVITEKLALSANATALRGSINVKPGYITDQQTGGHHLQLYNLGTFLDHDVNQEDLIRRPDFTGFAKLTFTPLKHLSLHAAYRYTGSRFDSGYDGALGPYGALRRIAVDAYHLVDVGLHWQTTKVFSLAVKAENILDENYREVAGFQTRGRSGYLKIMARW